MQYFEDETVARCLEDSQCEPVWDVVVGIPSFNNAATICKVVETCGAGLKEYFPELKSLIINSDGGSTDGTIEAVKNARLPEGIRAISIPYEGIKGKGSALRAIFVAADMLNSRFCIITDADSRSIKPQWIKLLGEPIYKHNYGYVTPYYLRDKYDGTITNALVYPLTSALYGFRLRQPIGGDFAMSTGLLKNFIFTHAYEWYPDVCRFGVDIWMTTTAICEGFNIIQAPLGVKIHDVKDPGADLSLMFKQVVGTMFGMMRKYEMKWKVAGKSISAPVSGDVPIQEIEDLKINVKNLTAKFEDGFTKFGDAWKVILGSDGYRMLRKIMKSQLRFNFPADFWAKVIYDYSAYFNFSPKDMKGEILDSLNPLYCARTASFVLDTRTISDEMSDALVYGGANVFERLKPYLIEKWTNNEQRLFS